MDTIFGRKCISIQVLANLCLKLGTMPQPPSLFLSAAAIGLIFHNINPHPNVTQVNVLLVTVAVCELIKVRLDTELKCNVET